MILSKKTMCERFKVNPELAVLNLHSDDDMQI